MLQPQHAIFSLAEWCYHCRRLSPSQPSWQRLKVEFHNVGCFDKSDVWLTRFIFYPSMYTTITLSWIYTWSRVKQLGHYTNIMWSVVANLTQKLKVLQTCKATQLLCKRQKSIDRLVTSGLEATRIINPALLNATNMFSDVTNNVEMRSTVAVKSQWHSQTIFEKEKMGQVDFQGELNLKIVKLTLNPMNGKHSNIHTQNSSTLLHWYCAEVAMFCSTK